MVTCFPHRMRGEGQFAALLRRKSEAEALISQDRSLPKPDKVQLSILRAFCREAPAPTAVYGDTLVALPDCPDLTGLRVLRVGLHLGTVRGKLFLPDHAWAVCDQPPAFPRVSVTEKQAESYQHGDAMPVTVTVSGFVLPELKGLALGWGKVSDGMMKNHYPKGLRR